MPLMFVKADGLYIPPYYSTFRQKIRNCTGRPRPTYNIWLQLTMTQILWPSAAVAFIVIKCKLDSSTMPPHCLPDSVTMAPHCLRDSSTMPPHCLPDSSTMPPHCLPDSFTMPLHCLRGSSRPLQFLIFWRN